MRAREESGAASQGAHLRLLASNQQVRCNNNKDTLYIDANLLKSKETDKWTNRQCDKWSKRQSNSDPNFQNFNQSKSTFVVNDLVNDVHPFGAVGSRFVFF